MATEADFASPSSPARTGAAPGPHDVSVPEPALLVHLLGRPSIPQRPEVKGKELTLAVYLACQPCPVSADAVQHALWGGRSGHRKRLANLVSETRHALGTLDDGTPAFPRSDGARCGLRLADGVVTDLELLRASHRRAQALKPGAAIRLLEAAFGHVDGPPFDAAGYDWAHHTALIVADASDLIEDAAWTLADLALTVSDVGLARRTVRRGLRSLPGDESLYRLRMRIEHHAGNLAAVHSAYCELRVFLGALGIDAQPSSPTVALYRQLMGQDTVTPPAPTAPLT